VLRFNAIERQENDSQNKIFHRGSIVLFFKFKSSPYLYVKIVKIRQLEKSGIS